MANLANNDRFTLWADFMRLATEHGITFSGVEKADLRAMFDALDAYADSKTAEINAAIPQPARTALTTDAKILAYKMVVDRRFLRKVT